MSAVRGLLLLLAVISVCEVVSVNSFDWPSMDDIKGLFDDLYKKIEPKKSAVTDEIDVPPMDDKKLKRKKRQNTNIGDESLLPYEIKSSSLPMMPDGATINTRYMPTLGNGYLGLTVYDGSMYLNGVYNGIGGQSHRANIPALLMTKISLTNAQIDQRAVRKYILNAREGYFMEYLDCEYATVYHKIYLHQKYIRLLVVDSYAVLKPNAIGGVTVKLNYPSLNSTDDIIWQGGPVAYMGGSWQLTGNTKIAENGEKTQTVTIFYNDPLAQIPVTGSNWQVNYTQVMAVDKVASNARLEFDLAQKILQQSRDKNPNWQLFMEHANAWKQTWENGRVEITGSDSLLAKAAWFAQYYLLSSLPAEYPYLPPQFTELFYGLSRTGLGKGDLGKDYQGHVMYDNEYYLLPAVLPFHPFLAKAMLRYRSGLAKNAAANAKLHNNGVGYHYPWQSGTSGADVTPDTCPATNLNCYWNRLFVTAGVSYGIRMYYSLTRDRDYGINPIYSGCDVSREIARFLAGQAIYNPEAGRYDMLDITGPDDSHPGINNNAFTLCAVSLALHWARYYSCLCQRNERDEIPDEYIQKALYLNLPYDNVKRLHYQYEGFDPSKDTPVKQADTILLNYPLNWNYSVDIMKNDLMFYEPLMSDRTPAMTWSWFTIGWKWVLETSKMRTYFLKSYQDYIIQPFKIWTEFTEKNPTDQAAGNVNFLPGMAAFLQSLIYGFAGFRIRPDRLECHDPQPPPGQTSLILTNFYYLGSNITFTITADKTVIKVLAVNSAYPLILRRNQTGAVEESLTTGATVTIEKAASNGFFIYTSISETCEQPRDYIYMPWGYSPWINGSPVSALRSASFQVQLLAIVLWTSTLAVVLRNV